MKFSAIFLVASAIVGSLAKMPGFTYPGQDKALSATSSATQAVDSRHMSALTKSATSARTTTTLTTSHFVTVTPLPKLMAREKYAKDKYHAGLIGGLVMLGLMFGFAIFGLFYTCYVRKFRRENEEKKGDVEAPRQAREFLDCRLTYPPPVAGDAGVHYV